jgi:uncharacterized DUF497 family protein
MEALFEYDDEKSQANLQKHGVDFQRAQEIWKGYYVEFSARCEFENRYAIMGPLDKKLHVCIFTIRDDKIRIISCRRARKTEEKLYEKSINE